MVEPRAADEGGEAPCFAHLVDPESGRIPDALVTDPGEVRADREAATAAEPGPPTDRDAREGGG